MEKFSTCFLLLIFVAVVVSCTSNSPRLDGYKVKLERENVKEFVLYDTVVSLDYLTAESEKIRGVSNFEFFDRFDYPELKRELKTNSFLMLFNDSIQISVKIKPFDNLQYKRNLASDSSYYTRRFFYGFSESQVATTQISSISISVNNKLNEISASEFEDLFDPNIFDANGFSPTKAYVTEKGEILLQMDNSVGADFYYVFFLFGKEGNLKKRIVKSVV